MTPGWRGRTRVAGDRILDAAAELFAERGVGAVGMSDIAAAAGCSRATLYRYFPDRQSLRLAFVQREAVRVGRAVAAEVADRDATRDADRDADGASTLTWSVLAALRQVRASPALAAWFRDRDAGVAAALAGSSAVVAAIGRPITSDEEAARWLVRVVVSLLTVPGADEDDERRMVERFVAPVVAHGAAAAPAAAPAGRRTV